jgi:hypothetical protein
MTGLDTESLQTLLRDVDGPRREAPSVQREPRAPLAPLTGMHCWEFHHRVEGDTYQWYWRALTAEGKPHGESKQRFDTFLQALDDAKKNGFNQEMHEWYLATPGGAPCLRTVNDPPRRAQRDRKP